MECQYLLFIFFQKLQKRIDRSFYLLEGFFFLDFPPYFTVAGEIFTKIYWFYGEFFTSLWSDNYPFLLVIRQFFYALTHVYRIWKKDNAFQLEKRYLFCFTIFSISVRKQKYMSNFMYFGHPSWIYTPKAKLCSIWINGFLPFPYKVYCLFMFCPLVLIFNPYKFEVIILSALSISFIPISPS